MADELVVLRSMFPSWDVKVLEELLAAHQGNAERTVDAVLAMDTMSTAGNTQAPQLPPALAQAAGSSTRRQRSLVPCPSSSPRGKPRSRVKIPDDFLRLPVDEFLGLSEQEERDAILARMLQDQFFRDEVFSSEEFSSHFHDRQTQASASEKTAAEIADKVYVAMGEKFTSMSEVMKKKMHDMYTRFQMRNDTSKDPKSTHPLMQSDSESSDDEDLDDNSDVQRRNRDHRHSQGSPRRWSLFNTTGKPNTGTGASSKKDD